MLSNPSGISATVILGYECFHLQAIQPCCQGVNWLVARADSSGDPDGQGHPVVNSAPQRRRSPVEGESIHVDVDEHGSYRATWSGNGLGRSLGTNVRYRRASNLAGRNVSEA
jgi:hypothetical protein